MLGLSFRTVKELDDHLDSKMTGRPSFECKEFKVGNEDLEFYSRDILGCIQTLYGDPQFADHLTFAPKRHYTSDKHSSRIYNEMHTGDWWWTVQVHQI